MRIGNIEVYGIIYKITNLVNGKVYIGQTIKGFDERYCFNGKGIERVYKYHKNCKEHRKYYNSYLLRSIEKYGINNFEVIEVFDIAFSKEELDIKEDIYITLFDCMNRKCGYNRKTGGANGKHTKETREKISEALKGKKHPMYGKHFSEETRKKMSEANKGKNSFENKTSEEMNEIKSKMSKSHKNPLNYMTEEQIKERNRKISEAKKGKNPLDYMTNETKIERSKKISKSRKKFIICITTKKIFSSAKEGGLYYNCNKNHISEVCRGKRKSSGTYKGQKLVWKYLVWKHNKKLRTINN